MVPPNPKASELASQQQQARSEDTPATQLVSLIASPVPRLARERHPQLSTEDYRGFVVKCQQLERRVFPKAEAMCIDDELRKPNQYLLVALQQSHLGDHTPIPVMAYGVLALNKVDGVARITKVCTDPLYRSRGAGEHIVRSMLAALGEASALEYIKNEGHCKGTTTICTAGCLRMGISRVQLHVDEQRDSAVRLYRRCGFGIKATIPNYYSEGRDALLMGLSIAASS
ncbi:hypothetical protein EV174_004376 [Coemansia sp. RSA 2320]|nr:hypothetical protein EV174_004376 [Coemansia sp. RSA 2320]